MKTMTCRQLVGACDLEFQANTFDEIAKLANNMVLRCTRNKTQII